MLERVLALRSVSQGNGPFHDTVQLCTHRPKQTHCGTKEMTERGRQLVGYACQLVGDFMTQTLCKNLLVHDVPCQKHPAFY